MPIEINIDILKKAEETIKSNRFKEEKRTQTVGRLFKKDYSDQIILLVEKIEVDPHMGLTVEIDRFFDRIINTCLALNVTNVIFKGGGIIPIPEFFINFRNEYNIRVTVLEPNDYSNIPNIIADDISRD